MFLWPLELDVFRIAAEVEDVPLSDTKMFEQHPGGVGQACGPFAAEVGGEICDDVIETSVGMTAVEKFEKMFAKRFVRIHELSLFDRTSYSNISHKAAQDYGPGRKPWEGIAQMLQRGGRTALKQIL